MGTNAEARPPETRLATIRSDEVEANPHNPRVIFDPEPMAILKESIEEVGILNPILAYLKKETDPRKPAIKYVILDGERRWLCARQIEDERRKRNEKLVEVPIPANIVPEPTTLQNILMMFHIHQVREPWEITPTALKLEVVLRHIGKKTPRQIANLTGLTTTRVRDCMTLLTFDKKYLDMSLREKPKRITGDFFIQMYPVLELIGANYPRLYRRFGRKRIVDSLIEKYEAGEITAVTEFRDFANLIRAKNIGARRPSQKKVEELITSPTSIKSAYKELAKEYWRAEKMRLTAERLLRSLDRLDVSKISRRAPLYASLRKLRITIDEILEDRK